MYITYSGKFLWDKIFTDGSEIEKFLDIIFVDAGLQCRMTT